MTRIAADAATTPIGSDEQLKAPLLRSEKRGFGRVGTDPRQLSAFIRVHPRLLLPYVRASAASWPLRSVAATCGSEWRHGQHRRADHRRGPDQVHVDPRAA